MHLYRDAAALSTVVERSPKIEDHFCIYEGKGLDQFITKANNTSVVPEQYYIMCRQL